LARLLFVSDLHLSPQRPLLLERFAALLEREAGRCGGLYILGDLFDAWIGDDDPSPFASQVRALLARFSAATPAFFLRGNRDFMVGERFADETGLRLLPDEHRLEVGERRLLLMHGDQLCTNDVEYQQVRALVRTPRFREEAMRKGIEERRALAAEYRRRSGESLSLKADDIMDVAPEAVVRALREAGADLLVHGHTHRPAIHRLRLDGTPAQRVVLPDWREEEPRLGFWLESGKQGWLRMA